MKPFALALLVLSLAACDDKPAPVPTPATPKTPPKAAANQKQDPVCGMKGTDFKLKGTVEGKDHVFCSDKCKADFDKNPVKYKWGFCNCSKTMKDCDCDHCKKNSEPCDCANEKPGEHDHDHDHK